MTTGEEESDRRGRGRDRGLGICETVAQVETEVTPLTGVPLTSDTPSGPLPQRDYTEVKCV